MSDVVTPPEPRISISRKVILGVVFTLAMLALIALTSFLATRRFQLNAEAIALAREVLETTERLQRHTSEMESGVRGFLLSGEEQFLIPHEQGYSFIVQDIQQLREGTVESPEQQMRLGRIQGQSWHLFEMLSEAIQHRKVDGVTGASDFFSNSAFAGERDATMNAIQEDLIEFEQSERRLLRSLREENEEIGRVSTSLIVGGTSLTYISLLVACLFILRDIAARSRAEEALEVERNLLHSIMNTIPDQIFVKDTRSRYLRDNVAHRRYLGVEKEEEVVGKTVDDFFKTVRAEQSKIEDRQVFETQRPFTNHEVAGRTRDGQEVWFEITKVPLHAGGRLIGLVGVTSDITARKNSEEKLKHFTQQLQRSNDELQNFASVASHDLQEPLRKIQAFGDRLKVKHSDALGDQGREFLGRMLDAAQRMQILIQDLLKLSRISTRAQPFERCQLNQILKGVLSDLEIKIASSGAQVVADDLPMIEADPTQIRQLFQNLIANALKFQKPGIRPVIQIRARLFENRQQELSEVLTGTTLCEITFEDNGIGFDQNFAEKIFVIFQRLHSREQYEGTGIGLAVCRKIMDRHRGKIVARSTQDAGATFIVTLPVHQIATQRS